MGEIVVICYYLGALGMSCECWTMVFDYRRRVYLHWECETSLFVWRVRLLYRICTWVDVYVQLRYLSQHTTMNTWRNKISIKKRFERHTCYYIHIQRRRQIVSVQKYIDVENYGVITFSIRATTTSDRDISRIRRTLYETQLNSF